MPALLAASPHAVPFGSALDYIPAQELCINRVSNDPSVVECEERALSSTREPTPALSQCMRCVERQQVNLLGCRQRVVGTGSTSEELEQGPEQRPSGWRGHWAHQYVHRKSTSEIVEMQDDKKTPQGHYLNLCHFSLPKPLLFCLLAV